MSVRPSPELPDAVVRAARLSPVPLYLRAIFSRLPESLSMTAQVGGAPEALPLAARQLLKLGLLSEQLVLRSAQLVEPPGIELVIRRGDRSFVPSQEELSKGITFVAQRILDTLFAQGEAGALLQSFAFQSSNLATLRTITNFMLQSTDVDQALYILLSGITSGYSLGFNRAALFVWDPQRRAFVGSKAIGPNDEEEAHRIWEAIEYEDKSIESLIQDYALRNFDTRFQQLVQSVALVPELGDEVSRALQSIQPVLFRRPEAQNSGLKRLGVSSEYVLAALKPHGKTLGVVLADNRFNHSPVFPDQLAYFAFFIDQTALVWENLALLKSIEELARVDGLTGTFNRRELEARLGVELARCQRHGRPCSLLLADVDLFKEINDSKGHVAGDEVLRKLGALLKEATRVDDVVGRFGGDEFVVIMPEAPRDELIAAGRKIGALAAERGISLSLGGACWPGDCREPRLLLAAADEHLYRAKHAGRGCACFPGLEPISFK
jgi:diguanylate cyclase (GGDEF)-like protein